MNTSTLEVRSPASVAPHLVQFYETDEFLAGAVTDFLCAGAGGDEPMLLVVSEAHRSLLVERLARTGVDVAKATADGRLTVLDARDTLALFMRDGRPDAALFEQHVGGEIAALLRLGPSRRVRAFGEMVDVLWREDQADAAIRLEELWNELQQKHAFSLFCAYLMGNFPESGDRHEVARLHSHVLPAEAQHGEHAHSLSAELLQRQEVERALRNALRQQRLAETALRSSEQQLKEVTDALPVLVSYVDRDYRYRFANQTHQKWFGREPAALLGRPVSDQLDEATWAQVRPRLDEAFSGTTVKFETPARYADGHRRHVEVTYTPHRAETPEVVGVIALVRDVTEEVRLREASAAAARKNERVLKITGAIADAVTAEQVFEAVVDQVGEAIGASSAALWLLGEDGRTARLVRAKGYSAVGLKAFDGAAIDGPVRFPGLDALRDGKALWFPTIEKLVEAYPNLAGAVTPGKQYQVACIPLVVQGQTVGALGFSFDSAPMFDEDERPFIMLVARYSSQALERLKLLAAEKRNRAQAELLFGLAQAVIRSEKVDEIFPATLEAIDRALGAKRSAILVYDDAGVMRFRAWRGLSDGYRQAVEGHSPWPRDAQDPQIVWVADAAKDPSLSAYRELLERERIGALGFIPLVASGRLLGKFMVYYDQPRTLAAHEVELARAIANHIAAATARLAAIGELQQAVHFNEMFTGILGHDLRNPLAAIMTGAQLLIKRTDDEKHLKPLARIMSSGGRMARMIDQLLDFTRVRVGQGIPLRPKRLDVKPLAELAIEELEGPERQLSVVLESQGDTVGLWDGDRLAQVFSNLIGNALQHGTPGGRVTVSLDGTSAEVVRATVHNPGAVDATQLPRLFEPMMGSDRRGEKSHGLGLGLFISRQIVRAHGGAISVDSNEASGTTFLMSLPRAPR